MGLYSWGCNSFGQLALETGGSNDNLEENDLDDNRTIPTQGICIMLYSP